MNKELKLQIIKRNKNIMSRPIQRINQKSYFATSLPLSGKDGKDVTSWVVTDVDFKERYSQFELEGHKSFSQADFDVALSVVPRPGLTLSAEAYVAHAIEGKPIADMAHVFRDTVASIDRFVSFDGSFAAQRDMAEFLACWVTGTYATDVFDTVGYVWPNGERASGKTQCLKTLMSLAFMGQAITSSSSFASVRDEASLGASLGFDDCETIQKMDPNKRELLLAGNTKGAGFMFKEPGKREGQWNTKFIDTFAPRAFTSISLPDDVLASRTIIIPLIRSGDIEKTRRKPTNAKDWGNVDPVSLRDSLWLNVAKGLGEIEARKEEVDHSTDLSGRDFDIFQGPLTVACWLDKNHGFEGLFERMLNVMEAYHATKQKNLLPSLENVVLQAMMDKLNYENINRLVLPTQEIVDESYSVLHRWDITDAILQAMDKQKVGILLGRLGFDKAASHGKARSWEFTRKKVEEKARLAGVTLEVPEKATQELQDENPFGLVEPWPSPKPASSWDEVPF